ncbi:MAG: transcription termination/antitermination protein NusA [Acidobacteria bacterium]|nr:transcription termination/antitermination protein NusA [Acidobacteriota bacterium]
MITSIGQSIDVLKEEYGLDRELVIEAMKDAVRAAARKQFKSEYKAGEGIQVDWDDEQGMIEISAQKTVVEEVESPTTELSLTDAIELTGDDEIELGDILLLPLPTEELGRIAAQTAKQILMQKVREAIREKVYEEYIDRKGELINGLVKRFERGDMIVDLGTNLEAVLPRREQSRGEVWNINERLRVVIADVSKELRGQQVIVSRASAELLKRLFEMEVPEIYDGTVTVKSAVREPGDRAKIAVSSNEKDVDPVGACVGMKGARVQAVIKELRGEKIDIIEWSDEPSVFAANALSPAKVSQVRITDINERKMEVIVSEDQLSLAIGRHGQNVRLATRLVGWDIDIVSEEVLKKEIAQQMGDMIKSGGAVPISVLDAVSASNAEVLAERGIEDIEALAATSVDELVEILDISLDESEAVLASAKEIVELKNAPEPTEEEAVEESAAETAEAAEAAETPEAENTEVQVAEDTAIPEEAAADEPIEAEAETGSAEAVSGSEVEEISAAVEAAEADEEPEPEVSDQAAESEPEAEESESDEVAEEESAE